MDPEELKLATERITKRLGGQNVKAVVELIDAGKIRAAFDILLDYYDRSYNLAKSKQNRCSEVNVPISWNSLDAVCQQLVDAAEKLSVATELWHEAYVFVSQNDSSCHLARHLSRELHGNIRRLCLLRMAVQFFQVIVGEKVGFKFVAGLRCFVKTSPRCEMMQHDPCRDVHV